MSKQTDLINIPDAITVSGSNVGIGTSSPSAPLTVKAPADAEAIHVVGRSDDIGQIKFMEADGTTELAIIDGRNSFFNIGSIANIPLKFATNNSERMRIDSSGNVLVGGTTTTPHTNTTTPSSALMADGEIRIATQNSSSLELNRTSSDGNIINLRKGGTQIGNIGTNSGQLYIASPYSNDSGLVFSGGEIHPCTTTGAVRDNGIMLGAANKRFSDVHAVNYHGDGSNLTGVGGSTSLAAVGTYAMFFNDTGQSKNPGDTISGSTTGFKYGHSGGSTLPTSNVGGTWRAMGAGNPYNATVWVRIS